MQTIRYKLIDQQGNESMQTVLIMAVGAMIMIGVNTLFRQVSPTIQQYMKSAVSGESVDKTFGEGRFAFNQHVGKNQPEAINTDQNNTMISMQELLRQAAELAYFGKPGERTSDGQWLIAENGLVEDHTGFRAVILTPADGSNTGAIVAFAGTDIKSSFGGAVNDIANNVEQTIFGASPQYIRAVRLAAALKERYNGNIYLTGHSLGGGQAALASTLNHVPGVAFNPAPLGGIAAISTAVSELGTPASFTNYRNRFDPVSHLQDNPRFPGRQVGETIELEGDYGWPGFGFSDHGIANMKVEKK